MQYLMVLYCFSGQTLKWAVALFAAKSQCAKMES